MKFEYSEEVRDALSAGKPVLALESTLITHGLPKPENARVGRQLEQTARDGGVVPATMALLNGRLHAGISVAQLELLAALPSPRKCSIRDLPVAAARGESGGTTVAATMQLAHAAGIRVFSTGGIGGVHRGQPFDVSADLTALGAIPMTVVCAGAKSILDVPLTLEVLETKGVTVVGYCTDEFPLFYCRTSGLPVDVRCDTPEEIAAIIQQRDEMKLSQAILVVNPVPEADAIPADEAEQATRQALADAESAGIHGKDVTPFLLARVSALTSARSMKANLALLDNNVRLGAAIARVIA